VRGHIAYRLRAELRRRRRRLVGLALLVALLGGLVLATAAGARRTSTAYERLIEVTNPPELLVSPPGGPGDDPTPFYAALSRLPGVLGVRVIAGIPLLPQSGTPSAQLPELGIPVVVAAMDEGWESGAGRPRLTSGRFPDEANAEEVMVSERLASQTGLMVGDHIDAVVLTAEPTGAELAVPAERGLPIRLVVTGIGLLYDEVVPFSDLDSGGRIMATAPLAALIDRDRWDFEGAQVDVAPGTDLGELTAAVHGLAADESLGTGGLVFVSDQVSAARQVDDAMQPLAAGLTIAAFALGLVTLAVTGQAVVRSSHEDVGESEALRSVGWRPADNVTFALCRGAVIGLAGGLGAMVVALLASRWFPISIARVAEPSPGIRADTTVLVWGGLALALVTALFGVPPAVAATRERTRPHRPSGVARRAASAGLSPAAVQGLRFAVVGGGTRPVPLRSTLLAVTIATTSVFASMAFAESLVGLVETPARYGQGWDRMVDAQFGPAPVGRVIDRLGSHPSVAGLAVGNYGDVTVGGAPVPAVSLGPISGSVGLTLVEGRTAAGPNEIVLGGEVLDRLDAAIGDTVEVDAGAGPEPMQVTGRGVFPHLGQGSFSTTGLGIGAQLASEVLPSFRDGQEVPSDYLFEGRQYNFVAIDIEGPTSAVDAELADIERSMFEDGGFGLVRHEQPPTKILDLDRVRVVPVAMAAVLGIVALVTLAHLLLSSVRERRRELGLLRTLGFTRRQLQASVAWQASLLVVAALCVGVPVGIALGRVIWQGFAERLHVAAPAETSPISIVWAVALSILLANLMAAVPARQAAVTRPSEVLRRE
jgi:ABC-type lipoprotein release transport system permease subunit